MLSIIILFCDKDYKYLPELIKNIKENVLLDYELILIDNREKNSDLLQIKDNYQYFAFGYNARQVQGRKKGIELAKGDYVWFVDADDSVSKIVDKKLLQSDSDIIVFNSAKDFVQKNNILSYEVLCDISVPLWNKWIKTEVLKKVEENIPNNIDGSASEDTLLVIGSLKYSKSIMYCKDSVYNYNTERSSCSCSQIKTTEHFQRIIYGHDKVVECIMNILSPSEQKQLGLTNHFIDDCSFFLKKIASCSEEIIKDCVKILAQYFTEDQIIKTWKLYAASSGFSKIKYLLVREQFQEIYKDRQNEFVFIGNREYIHKNENGQMVVYKTEKTEILPLFKEN